MSIEVATDLRQSLKKDGWLTEKLGRPVWKVESNSDGESLAMLESTEPLFAYAKVNIADIANLWSLTGRGFRVVDVALTFEGTVVSSTNNATCRFASPADRERVTRIADTTFRYSRFHLDPLLAKEIANAIKSEWVANYFRGKRGDGLVVAERDHRVVGFLQLLWEPDNCLLIDLIGVDAGHQGRGIGSDMIRFASRYGTGDQRRPARIKVGTQAANTPSVRLYESLGLRLINAQYVLHYHGRQSAA